MEPPDLLKCDYTDEEGDTELLSLSNPQSSGSEGVGNGAAHRSSGCGPSHVVMPSLGHAVMSGPGVMPSKYAWALP